MSLRTVSVTLTDAMVAAVDEAVVSGDYANAGEVVRDALRAWSARRALHLSRTRPARTPADDEPDEGELRPDRKRSRDR